MPNLFRAVAARLQKSLLPSERRGRAPRAKLSVLELETRLTPAVTARDPWREPYTVGSIWNTSLGNSAQYVDISSKLAGGIGVMEGDVEDFYYGNPSEPVVQFYNPYYTPERVSTELPDGFLFDASTGSTPNNASFFLRANNTFGYAVQKNGLSRTYGQTEMAALNVTSDDPGDQGNKLSLFGTGRIGSHLGSHLSTLGGSLRVGELTGSDPINHALKINLPEQLLYRSLGNVDPTNQFQTYMWPAVTSDGGSDTRYGIRNNDTPALRMGSLLAIPPGVTASSLGLTLAPAVKLFNALQNYGAYVVDTSAAYDYRPYGKEYIGVPIEAGARQEFQDVYGYEFNIGSPGQNRWATEMAAIFRSLDAVADNRADNVGGNASTGRRGPTILPLAYGVRKDVADGTQIEAEDYNPNVNGVVGSGFYDTDNTQNGRASNPYRRDGATSYRNDAVDVAATPDADNGAKGSRKVGWTATGEYLKYDINVTTAGTYTLTVRVASGASGGSLHFEDESGNVLGRVTVGGRAGGDSFQNFSTASFFLSAGNHTIRLVEDTGGYDLNWFRFTAATSGGERPELVG